MSGASVTSLSIILLIILGLTLFTKVLNTYTQTQNQEREQKSHQANNGEKMKNTTELEYLKELNGLKDEIRLLQSELKDKKELESKNRGLKWELSMARLSEEDVKAYIDSCNSDDEWLGGCYHDKKEIDIALPSVRTFFDYLIDDNRNLNYIVKDLRARQQFFIELVGQKLYTQLFEKQPTKYYSIEEVEEALKREEEEKTLEELKVKDESQSL
jgi:hypothetical protein